MRKFRNSHLNEQKDMGTDRRVFMTQGMTESNALVIEFDLTR